MFNSVLPNIGKQMLKTLNFKHIFYFWVVGKEASISKASIILNVSQSSISEQIKILEERINNLLFDRTQKKMNLTSSGKVLFNILDEFFPAIEELFESLANHKSADVKFLRIGLCPTLSEGLRFNLCYPFIEDIHYTVKVLQGENEFLMNAFDKDEIDLIFATNDNINPYGKTEKFVIGEKKFCIVTNNNVFKQLPKTGKIKALTGYKYINYTPDSDLHFKIQKFMHKNEIDRGLIRKVSGPVKGVDSRVTAIYKPKFKSERFSMHLKNIARTIKL